MTEADISTQMLDLVKKQNDVLETFKKDFTAVREELTTLKAGFDEIKKLQDKNPVAHGNTLEQKPGISNANDVGASTPDKSEVAPDGSATGQVPKPSGGISKGDEVAKANGAEGDADGAPTKGDGADGPRGKQSEGAGDGGASDSPPKDGGSDGGDNAGMKKSDSMQKSSKFDSYQYEIVKSERPMHQPLPYEQPADQTPTGYQIIKATLAGWGGTHSSAEASFKETYERLARGEFGTGNPGGVF